MSAWLRESHAVGCQLHLGGGRAEPRRLGRP
jgi:hypothetical protein